MRCSRKSTTSRSSAVRGAVAVLLATAATVSLAGQNADTRVEAAIGAGVVARLGVEAAVTVTDLHVRWLRDPPAGGIVATPEPASRLGSRVRFSLRQPDGRAAGQASALVQASGAHLRAARDLPRGHVVTADDVEAVTGDLGRAPLRTLPRDVMGARVLLPLAAAALFTPQAVAVPPLVRSGDAVVTRVRVPGLEVRGRAVAAQDGELGAIIRAVNPESRRPLKVRVIGRGEVEVVHGS